MSSDEVRDIEEKIADLKARWPAHSVPAPLWQELEELEEALRQAQETSKEENHAGKEGPGRL